MTKTMGTVPEKHITDVFLDKGADANSTNSNGTTPLRLTIPMKPYPYSTSAFCASRCILSNTEIRICSPQNSQQSRILELGMELR